MTDRERLDAHNTSVDSALQEQGRCGVIHLPTGRRCFLEARHQGTCTFLPVSREHIAKALSALKN